MDEIWKDIEGYNGLYQVSNAGRIRSIHYSKSKILKQNIIRNYYYVSLSKCGLAKKLRVSRLVAKAFIDNSFNKQQVNHIDGNKLNNCINNLEWCTASENLKHAFRIGKIKPKYGKDNPMYGKRGKLNPFYGKKHSDETIKKMKSLCSISSRGERNASSKLTDWDVKFIKVWIKEGYKQSDISKVFKISKGVISNIKVGRTWKHIRI